MKKALIILMCLTSIIVASTSLKAQEVTITLIPGWTWISCPMTEALDFAEALGDFTPIQGDIIQSQWGLATYTNGQWRGSISQFYPGYGYMYKSNRTMPVTLTFNVQQPAPQVVVTTSEPMMITAISAMGGGEVTVSDGTYIIARGLCWATHENPTTNEDTYVVEGGGTGNFTATMTGLNISTTYYVRAYAVTLNGTVYGNQFSFYTHHVYVDLGLPSGTLWATYNVGAEVPENYGDYFAWGETSPKDNYNWSNYQYCMGNSNTLTKYCNNPDIGYNGFTDDLTTLLPEDDAATANWGDDWRMPTRGEWWELRQKTTLRWTTMNGVNGMLFTGGNGNTLFLPAAGYYWSNSLDTDNPDIAWDFFINSSGSGITDFSPRCSGRSVRAVCSGSHTPFIIDATASPMEGGEVSGGGSYQVGAECTLTATANEGYIFANWTENGEVVSNEATYSFLVDADRTLVANFNLHHTYVDLGLPSGLLWATCNLGANIPEEYGDYFAWGETQPKDNFTWTNYQYCMGSFNTLTKYCNNPDIGYNGFTDDLTTLLPEDDAATANWGDEWRMPTEGEWQELYQNTTVTWTTQNGVNGRLFTASNGNSLFLPAAGYCNESVPEAAGIIGDYWTSSVDTDYPSGAQSFFFNSSNYYIGFCNRLYGRNVRAVRPSQSQAYVDLGLPSGLLWATCNVGAEVPEDYGDYFAWGETEPKDTYNWSTYQYCNGSGNTLTKYCNRSTEGYNGFTDNLTTLLPEDDAATANWGADWRMPTEEEWQELCQNTTITWTTQNGVNGRLFTASNGNSLFLPAAGYRYNSNLYGAGSGSCGWSSSLYTQPDYAWYFYFNSGDYGMNYSHRYHGFTVRPVCSSRQN